MLLRASFALGDKLRKTLQSTGWLAIIEKITKREDIGHGDP